MYSERDLAEVNGRIRKDLIVALPVVAVLLVAFIYALKARVQWLAMAALPLTFVAVCFAWIARLWPNVRYRGFLVDMMHGLSRDREGTIVEVSEKAECQDGCMVLPVRILLEEEQDERIVYVNASKAEAFPKAGAKVRLKCFGRHIRQVETV